MKILLVNKFFYPKGGSEKVFFQQREYLKKNNYEVIDFSMNDIKNFHSIYSKYFVRNVNYHSSSKLFHNLAKASNFIHSSDAIYKLKKLIQDTNPDIAHLHNIYHQLTPSIIPILKNHGIKVIMTLHDGKLICPSYNMLSKDEICVACEGKFFWKPIIKNCQSSFLQEILLSIESYFHKWKKSYEYVDRFIVPSKFFQNIIKKRIPQGKISVLYNGIDLKKYKTYYSENGHALYFGRIAKEKGVETLLKAHQNFYDRINLTIVGTGPLLRKLENKYKNAKFLGFKLGTDLKSVIYNSSCVIVPSECNENCSMTVLEAMAAGKPVIGSRIGGIPEQIDDNKTGLLFESGNISDLSSKLSMIWNNPELRINMGETARKKVEKLYSLDIHLKNLLKIYNKLLN